MKLRIWVLLITLWAPAGLLCLAQPPANPAQSSKLSAQKGSVRTKKNNAMTKVTPSYLDKSMAVKAGEKLKELYDLRRVPIVKGSPAKEGKSAEGEVLAEGKGELYLDTDPCEPDVPEKDIVRFTQPYKKEVLEDKTCKDTKRKYKHVKVTQTKKDQ